MKVAASGRMRLTSSATDPWSGPITTASAAPVPLGAAASTCASSDRPATGCSTFGRLERIRVPSPAASTTVRLDRADIPILAYPCSSGEYRARRRHKPFSAPRKRPGFKLGAHFLLRFMRDSGGLGAGLTGLMAKNSDHFAGTFEA